MSKKHFKLINTLFVVIPMSLVMAIAGTTHNHGLCIGWGFKVISAWMVMLPIAFLAAFIIIPPARKLAERVTEK
ncbi:MAG: DUF2798 domain-containing protein [Bacteroidota bacterium]